MTALRAQERLREYSYGTPQAALKQQCASLRYASDHSALSSLRSLRPASAGSDSNRIATARQKPEYLAYRKKSSLLFLVELMVFLIIKYSFVKRNHLTYNEANS